MPDNKEDFQALTVAVRVRPISDAEVENGCTEIAHVIDAENMVALLDPSDDQDDILRMKRSREKQYVFDVGLGPNSSQELVYTKTTKDLIDSIVDGYNATVFAYGPTGAGKTHTMLGTDDNPGIMVRTLNDLFKEMEKTKNDSKYQVTMSYLEIYNEMIRDLLNPSAGYLDLREDSRGLISVAGLSKVDAETTKEVMQMLSMGNRQRTCEPTAVNKTSSRSHAVLQVTVRQSSKIRNIVEEFKVGKLFMIDLAGSERAAQTQNRGKRLIEGAHINRSLLALGNCINALSERGMKGSYINFRDSKLTRLLKDSLGGNCRTVMIAHISPASMCFEESRNTLNYADRAKNIKLKVKRNQYNVSYHIAQYQSIISELRQEILRLKTKMTENELHARQASATTKSKGCKESKLIEQLRMDLVASFQQQMEVRRKLIDLEESVMRMNAECQRNVLTIDEWEQDRARQLARYDVEISSKDPRTKPPALKKLLARRDKVDPLDIHNKDTSTEKNYYKSFDDGWEPEEVTIAREELRQAALAEKDIMDRNLDLTETLVRLKKEREELEDSLPHKVTCDEHREVLKLVCNVHELELKNVELDSMRMLQGHLMQEKDLSFQRQEMRQKLCDEIIQLQRTTLEDNQIDCPPELEILHQLYMQQFSDNFPSADDTSQYSSLGSTANLQSMTASASHHDHKSVFASGATSMPILSTVIEDNKPQLISTSHSRRSRKTWIESLSDMEADDTSKIELPPITPSGGNTMLTKAPVPVFARQDTATTFTIDDEDQSELERKEHIVTGKQKVKLRKKKLKKKAGRQHGFASDSESIYNLSDKGYRRIKAKPSLSDFKLFNSPHIKKPRDKKGVRMAHSMNDLSIIETPKRTLRSIEDLSNNEDGNMLRKPQQRQRSSSLDMGREKLRLRQLANAQKAKKSLVRKPSDSRIPVPRLVHKVQRTSSVNGGPVLIVDPKIKKYLNNTKSEKEGDIKAFITNPTPPQTIQQIGTPPGKGLLIQRQFRGLVPERTFVSYASTTSVAKAKPKKAKAAHTGDGLSISGTSVVPKQTKPGSKRY